MTEHRRKNFFWTDKDRLCGRCSARLAAADDWLCGECRETLETEWRRLMGGNALYHTKHKAEQSAPLPS